MTDGPHPFDTLTNELRDLLAPAARILSDLSEYGAILNGGETVNGAGRDWSFAIATNDAACHLRDWAREQVRIRDEAAKAAGITNWYTSDGEGPKA